MSDTPPTPRSRRSSENIEDPNTTFYEIDLSENSHVSPPPYPSPSPTHKKHTDWKTFLGKNSRIILGALLGIFLIVLAFTPLGQGLTAFFFLKSLCCLMLALSKSAFVIKFFVGIGLFLSGFLLSHFEYFLCATWLLGWAMKLTAWVAKGCLDLAKCLITPLLRKITNPPSPRTQKIAGFALVFTILFIHLPLSIFFVVFSTIANFGDKFLRRHSASYALPVYCAMTNTEMPPPVIKRASIPYYYAGGTERRYASFQESRNQYGFFAAWFQETEDMAWDSITVGANPDDNALGFVK